MLARIPIADRELFVTRLIDAPSDQVFRIWCDPRIALGWWGIQDCQATHVQIDLRVGGRWSGRLRASDGRELRQGGIIRELVPPRRLGFTFNWEEVGERNQESLVSVNFAGEGSRTRLELGQRPFRSRAERDDYVLSWSQAIDRFVASLARACGGA